MFLIVNRGKEVEDYRQNHQVRYLHASRELKCLFHPLHGRILPLAVQVHQWQPAPKWQDKAQDREQGQPD